MHGYAEMENVITIVSGLPRSGTSLMMKMLEAGGLSVVVDGIRKADQDNPKGYYEYERVKKIKEDTAWLGEAQGKVFKMVSMLLMHLPLHYNYDIFFMKRDLKEVVASQEKMLTRNGKQPAADAAKLEEMYRKHIHQVETWLAGNKNIRVLPVSFGDIFRQPQEEVKRVTDFIGRNLDPAPMLEAIEPSLYRNRARESS